MSDFKTLFSQACQDDDTERAMQLFTTDKEFEAIFFSTCAHDSLNTAVWMMSEREISEDTIHQVFRTCKTTGHIIVCHWVGQDIDELAEWLDEQYEDEEQSNKGFVGCCQYGYIAVAELLYGRGEVTKEYIDEGFAMACCCNKREMAKYVYTLGVSDEIVEKVKWRDFEHDDEMKEWLATLE